MIYPKIDYTKLTVRLGGTAMMGLFYAYNYPIFTYNFRYRTIKHMFPFMMALGVASVYKYEALTRI
jgi:hypothetical protein